MLFYVINIITTKVKRSQILNIVLVIFILKYIYLYQFYKLHWHRM